MRYVLLIATVLFSFCGSRFVTLPGAPRWKTKAIPYRYGVGANRFFKTAVKDALTEWELASGDSLRFVYAKNEPHAILFEFISNWDRSVYELAVASPRYSEDRSEVLSCRIRLNNFNYVWHRGAPFLIDQAQRRTGRFPASIDNVLLHEIGHALGLDHSPVVDSIVYNKVHTFINSDDIAAIEFLYGD